MRGWVVVLLLLLSPGVGWTQEVDPDTEAAQRHFVSGSGHYAERRYPEAIAEFEAARQLKQAPALDFNIARCHDRLEHWDAAIAAYQRYIDAAGAGEDVEEARRRVEQLRLRLAASAPLPPAQPAAVAAVSAPVVPPPSSPRRRSRAWIGGVVALGVVVGGGVAVGVSLAAVLPAPPATTDGSIAIAFR